ncbi:MAG: flagellar basal body rod protein FlgG [Gemmatales bacterium]|nr:MAG: flagellar basal body rod protein FlgG [Gemmatales bacterium]
MIRALSSAATGMIAQQFLVDNTANNLANVNTTGFKRSKVDFQDLVFSTLRAPGSEVVAGIEVPTGLQIGNGVRVAGNTGIFTQGPLENTGNALDIAIEGEGFFQVTAPDGSIRYTRDGSFRLNATGQIVNADGFLLEPALTVPTDTIAITIAPDGTVSVVTGSAPTTTTTVGTITLARFVNPAGLSREGRNLFRETAASGAPVLNQPGQEGTGLLQQGFLERSNVEVVQELVNLILAQRAYEFNARAIRVSDSMLATANDLVRQ